MGYIRNRLGGFILAVIRLMIADNSSMMREGLKLLLESEDNFQVIGKSDDITECLHILSEKKPDLLILNIAMPDQAGFSILNQLNREKIRPVKVLILTECDDIQYLFQSIEIGIDGYLLKQAEVDELKQAIISIMDGETYIQPDLLLISNEVEKHCNTDLNKMKQLTKRELDVLKNLAVGMYNKEIALKLNISERTVKNHISSIFKKIGVSDRTQAAVFSIRNHLIDIY